VFLANLCLLLGIKSSGIPQLVTNVYIHLVNGQKLDFSGVGTVKGIKHHLQSEEIASVSNCMIRSNSAPYCT
jgi:hypothetical protein